MKKRFVLRFEGQKRVICDQVNELPADGTIEVTMKTLKTTRSLEQNHLYWMWVGIMADNIGYTKNQMHDALRGDLLEPASYPCLRTNKTKQRLRSTTELSVKDMTAYLEAVDQFAAEFFGIVLPRPDEQYAIAMGWERVNAKKTAVS